MIRGGCFGVRPFTCPLADADAPGVSITVNESDPGDLDPANAAEEDFLAGASACSVDDPECEACQ